MKEEKGEYNILVDDDEAIRQYFDLGVLSPRALSGSHCLWSFDRAKLREVTHRGFSQLY